MKKCNMVLTLTLLTSISLTGCNDNSEAYKQRIQQDNDRRNPTGNKAICLSLGYIPQNGFPYTIKYIEGKEDRNLSWDPIYWNNKLNRLLTLYAKEGLFTEELVGDEDNGKPLYRYQLTAEGLKYAHWWAGSGSEKTYFCFGRVVVDKINDSYDIGVNSKEITFSFHYENIPDWIKNDDIYPLYPTLGGKPAATGQQIPGVHEYYLYDGKLDKLVSGSSGRYTN